MKLKWLCIFFIYFSLSNFNPLSALGPTILQTGIWNSISSFQIVAAKIDGKMVKVCLPRLVFEDKVDQHHIKRQIKRGIKSQKAIFHLYHNGIGIPKKKAGMLFASSIYLKDLKMTYAGFLRKKLGYKFKVSKVPPFKDRGYLSDVMYSKVLTAQAIKDKKKKRKSKPEKRPKTPVSTMKVTTIYDVLPKGVIPPSIRRQQREIDRRIRILKLHTYLSSKVEVNPLRWAIGRMGLLRNDGSISGSFIEGKKPMIKITPPKEKKWLTPELINELNGQPCEFVFQRDVNGKEILQNGKYVLRDLYFRNLKLSWEEWLQKKFLTFQDLVPQTNYATTTVQLKVKEIKGKWMKLYSPAISLITTLNSQKTKASRKVFRVRPPNKKIKNFKEFSKTFDANMLDKELTVFMLMCPDDTIYTELGQKRAKEILFTKENKTLKSLLNQKK